MVITLFMAAKQFVKWNQIRFLIFSSLGFLVAINIQVENLTQEFNTLIKVIISSITINTSFFNPILNFNNLFQLILAILLGIFLYLFIRLLSKSNGIDILPFDHSSLELKDSNSNLTNGRAIADLLSAELHRIHHLHHFIEDGKLQLIQTSSPLLRVCREDLDLGLFKGEKIEKSLLQAGSISITDKTILQLGELLLTLRQLWPSGTVQIITGSIHQHDSKLRLTARCEQTNHQADVHAYVVNQTELESDISDAIVPAMVKMLAYRIALDLSSTALSTSNWASFKFLTEAISHFYRHERTKGNQSLSELNKAFECCKKAHEKDKDYKKVGDLLSLIAFSYLNKDEEKKAKESLQKALEINPRSSYVHTSYGNMYYLLGQHEKALDHYKYAQELDPTRPALYIRTGCVYIVASNPLKDYDKARRDFWNALVLDPNNNAAQSLLAWLDFLCHLEEQKQEHYEKAEISLAKACNRLANIKKDKRSYIDYSNLAIVFLYQGNEEKAHENWWKALQLCPNQTSDPSSDKLHHIFYRLLTVSSVEAIDQEIIQLNQILNGRNFPYRRVIEDLLWDAVIILNKCLNLSKLDGKADNSIFSFHTSQLNLDIIASHPLSENHRRLEAAMKRFIEVLQRYLVRHFAPA